jgi:hypothetical protein
MVVHSYNPNYSGGGDQEHLRSRQPTEKVSKNPISTNKPDMVVHTCNPSYERGVGRKMGAGLEWYSTCLASQAGKVLSSNHHQKKKKVREKGFLNDWAEKGHFL